MLLRWRPEIYQRICALAFTPDACRKSYEERSEAEKAILRGVLYQLVNAGCTSCPEGVDMTQARFSVGIFAEGLLASCQQTNQTLYNILQAAPNQYVGYVDMWRFALVNYNAGSWCLATAVENAWANESRLTWGQIQETLPPECRNAIGYVNSITGTFLP